MTRAQQPRIDPSRIPALMRQARWAGGFTDWGRYGKPVALSSAMLNGMALRASPPRPHPVPPNADAGLNTLAKRVFAELVDLVGAGAALPSSDALAERLDITPDRVRVALNSMQELGRIEVGRDASNRRISIAIPGVGTLVIPGLLAP